MSIKENIQEEQYDFPYHYLTGTDKGNFTLSRYLSWGMVQASYLDFIADKVCKIKPKLVLDAGCGDGRLIYELEKKIILTSFTGVDISKRALHFAQGFTKRSVFLIHDLIKGPLETKFDLCVSIEVIEHIPPDEITKYVSNIADSLANDGLLIITTPTTNLPLKAKHYQHFTKESLSFYVENRFDILETSFLNVENRTSNILARLLANKFFTINNTRIKNFIYKIYCRNFLHGSESTGSRIYILAKKK